MGKRGTGSKAVTVDAPDVSVWLFPFPAAAMALKTPDKLAASVFPEAVMEAATVKSSGCGEVGFVTPGMVNAICWPAGNNPAVKDTDRTVLLSEAVAAGVAVEDWVSNLTACPGVQAMPMAPVRVIASVLGEGIETEGVMTTYIVLPVAPAVLLARLIAGCLRPRLAMIAGKVPVELIATV